MSSDPGEETQKEKGKRNPPMITHEHANNYKKERQI